MFHLPDVIKPNEGAHHHLIFKRCVEGLIAEAHLTAVDIHEANGLL